tara:strand:+ start:895 stop:1377 length:483 start_codon:yes stop_codon:yes gene_type:complete
MFIQKFYKDFQSFNYTNKILAASSGFVFGMASKDYIEAFLKDILFPLVFGMIALKVSLEKYEKENPMIYLLLKFIWITFVWISTILFSFFILEYILNRTILGLSSSTMTNEEKDNYLEMKVDAKVSGILPDDKEIEKIEKEDELIEKRINERYLNIEEFM